MNHPAELFKMMVAILNRQFQGLMTFELVGSLAWKASSDHDADIVVHARLPVHLRELAAGFSGGQIEMVDRNSTVPFPGRQVDRTGSELFGHAVWRSICSSKKEHL
jgi:hypothetical protein